MNKEYINQAVTQEDLKTLGNDFRDEIKVQGDGLRGEIKTLGNNLRDEIRENTRDIISHFDESQGKQNEQLGKMGIQLEEIAEDVSKVKLAVIDILATDRHLHNLVRELKAQGVKVDEAKIFASL